MNNTSFAVNRGEQGSSMVLILLVLGAIFTLSVAGLSGARSGMVLSNNYRTSAQAEQAAESGLVHAVRAINNTGGVTSFLTDVANTTSWNALMGASALQMPGYSSITYTVNLRGQPRRHRD
jgi:Tfp pilus assembly protein PilX